MKLSKKYIIAPIIMILAGTPAFAADLTTDTPDLDVSMKMLNERVETQTEATNTIEIPAQYRDRYQYNRQEQHMGDKDGQHDKHMTSRDQMREQHRDKRDDMHDEYMDNRDNMRENYMENHENVYDAQMDTKDQSTGYSYR